MEHTHNESAQHFDSEKTLTNCFLCSGRDSNLWSWNPLDLEADALPIEPPRSPIIKSNKKFKISHHLHHIRSKNHIKTPFFIHTIKHLKMKTKHVSYKKNYNSKKYQQITILQRYFFPSDSHKGNPRVRL